MMRDDGLSIGELSARTGVKPVTLRAWERRYGLLRPARTEGGHRLYARSDVGRVTRVLSLLDAGVPIGRARHLVERPDAPAADEVAPAEGVDEAVRACIALNGRQFEQAFNLASRDTGIVNFQQHWLLAVRERLVSHAGAGSLALGFFDTAVHRKLSARLLRETRALRQRYRVLMVLPLPQQGSALLVAALDMMARGIPCLVIEGAVPTALSLQQAAFSDLRAVLIQRGGAARSTRALDAAAEAAGVAVQLLDLTQTQGNAAQLMAALAPWIEEASPA